MKDLFMCLLLNLRNHGKIVEANMYKGGTYSNIAIRTNDGIYRVSVMKEETEENSKENSDE